MISGAGNVAIYACQKANQLGMQSCHHVAIPTAGFMIRNGIDLAAIKEIKEVKRQRLTEYTKYRPNAEYHEGRGVWSVKCDVALPCATQNELHLEDAKQLGC